MKLPVAGLTPDESPGAAAQVLAEYAWVEDPSTIRVPDLLDAAARSRPPASGVRRLDQVEAKRSRTFCDLPGPARWIEAQAEEAFLAVVASDCYGWQGCDRYLERRRPDVIRMCLIGDGLVEPPRARLAPSSPFFIRRSSPSDRIVRR